MDCICQPKPSGEAPDVPDPACPLHGEFARLLELELERYEDDFRALAEDRD